MRRHGWRPEERLARLVGWIGALLWLLGLAWLASSSPWGWLVYDGLIGDVQSGSAVADAWLGLPLHQVTLAVALVGTSATLWLQRGQEERFEPLAVLAALFGVVGQSATIAALQFTGSYMESPALGLLDTGEALMAGAVLCGLAALPRLARRRQRRGWGMAVGVAGICAGALFFVERVFLHPNLPAESADGVELPRVEYASEWLTSPDEFLPVASVRADGSVRIEGLGLAAGDHAAWAARLRGVAGEMETRHGLPDEVLTIRADRRAPVRAVATLARLAAEAGIWKQRLEVARPAAWHASLRRGALVSYWPMEPAGGVDERSLALGSEVTLRVERSASGGVEYEYAGEVARDLAGLRALYAAGPRGELLVEADGDLSWASVAAALDAPELQRFQLMPVVLLTAE